MLSCMLSFALPILLALYWPLIGLHFTWVASAVRGELFAITGLFAMLWWKGKLSLWLLGIAALLLMVATAIPAAALWLQGKGESALPKWLRRRETIRETFEMLGEAPRELVRDPRLIVQLSLLNLAVFVADAGTLLFCLFTLGVQAPFDAAFVAFTMAAVVTLLGAVPLGLGSFEATSIAVLRLMGVPFEAGLSATLLYRGFALWLPLGIGLFLTRGLGKKSS